MYDAILRKQILPGKYDFLSWHRWFPRHGEQICSPMLCLEFSYNDPLDVALLFQLRESRSETR